MSLYDHRYLCSAITLMRDSHQLDISLELAMFPGPGGCGLHTLAPMQLMLERLINLQQNNSAAGFRKASADQCSLVGLPAGSELAEVLATALEHQEQTRLSYQP